MKNTSGCFELAQPTRHRVVSLTTPGGNARFFCDSALGFFCGSYAGVSGNLKSVRFGVYSRGPIGRVCDLRTDTAVQSAQFSVFK